MLHAGATVVSPAPIGNQWPPHTMISTWNKLYWFWTSSRLHCFVIFEIFSLSASLRCLQRTINLSLTLVVDVAVKHPSKGNAGVFQCSWIFFDGDQVNTMKAGKSNSALSVTSRPPRLVLPEQLQQKELLRQWVICWNTIHQLKGGFLCCGAIQLQLPLHAPALI